MPANPFRRRAPAPDVVTPAAEAMWAVAAAHVTARAIGGRAWTRAAALGRCYGVSVCVRDCAGGARVDLIQVQERARFYRCQVCERLLLVLVGDPGREGDADGA